MYEAVEKTLAETDMTSLSYQAVKIAHADWGFPGYGPAVLLVQVSPEVLDFQARLVAAVAPFTESGGTAEAFVADPGEVISPTIINWVEGYVGGVFRARSQERVYVSGSNASSFTKDATAAVLGQMPFDDTRDFDDVQRGLVAPLRDGRAGPQRQGWSATPLVMWCSTWAADPSDRPIRHAAGLPVVRGWRVTRSPRAGDAPPCAGRLSRDSGPVPLARAGTFEEGTAAMADATNYRTTRRPGSGRTGLGVRT